MRKKYNGVIIAGTSSMVGKTTIATGIMYSLSKKYSVQPYKVGPDYIDPTYHKIATNNKGRNLDSFFMTKEQVIKLFKKNSKNKDISIIEGVRGLYEGISPYNDIGSTSSIAKYLNCPVILIIDGRSLTRSAAAIIKGFKLFDNGVNIRGVIFNKVRGERHYKKLRDAVNYYIDNIEIIGAIYRNEELEVSQRHLGLVPTVENINTLKEKIKLWGNIVEEQLDLDKIVEISKEMDIDEDSYKDIYLWNIDKNKSTVGVPYDQAFNFYYWDNIDALMDNGGKIKYFSPLNDDTIPNCDILYIGGGYPEIFAEKLSNNSSMLDSIRNFDGTIYGECGGLMYLTKSINGYEMTGLLNCHSIMTDKVQGLNYVVGRFLKDCPIGYKNSIFYSHEFHYSKLIKISESNFAYKINRGRGIINNLDGIFKDNILGGYAHQHSVGNPYFPSSLINWNK